MVALVGLEPTWYCYHWILSPARLPISPQSHFCLEYYIITYVNIQDFFIYASDISIT